jgi:hypothetical protein
LQGAYGVQERADYAVNESFPFLLVQAGIGVVIKVNLDHLFRSLLFIAWVMNDEAEAVITNRHNLDAPTEEVGGTGTDATRKVSAQGSHWAPHATVGRNGSS